MTPPLDRVPTCFTIPMHRNLAAIWMVVACLLTGCPRQGLERAAVRGTVRAGSTLVETGSITFVPTERNPGPAAGGVIENGRFEIPAERGPTVGQHRVQVVGSRKTGRKVELRGSPGMMVDELVAVVPARFATAESNLIETIRAGDNELELVVPDK